MRALETNLIAGLVGPLDSRLQLRSARRYAQHPSTCGIKFSIPLRSPSVKNLHTINRRSLAEPYNIFPYLKRPWITTGRDHHTHRSIAGPLEISFANAPFNRRLQCLHQIALQPHQDGLRLRIAEAAIKFQHHRTAGGHHQSTVEHSLELGALG